MKTIDFNFDLFSFHLMDEEPPEFYFDICNVGICSAGGVCENRSLIGFSLYDWRLVTVEILFVRVFDSFRE